MNQVDQFNIENPSGAFVEYSDPSGVVLNGRTTGEAFWSEGIAYVRFHSEQIRKPIPAELARIKVIETSIR